MLTTIAMTALAATVLRWVVPAVQRNHLLWHFAFTCVMLFICIVFTAPFAPQIAFVEKKRHLLLSMFCTLLCGWAIGTVAYMGVWGIVAGLPMHYEDVFGIGIVSGTHLTTIVVALRMLRASGIRSFTRVVGATR